MLDRLVKFFTSLKLTVVLLGLGIILVFWGTLAQVHLGLYKAQNEFFRSFFIFWQPTGSSWRIPVFPGGYMIGGLLLINLVAAHTRYYQPGKKKIGIMLIHLGVVLLLLGQLMTDVLSRESSMHIRVGEAKNYSEADREYELAVVDTTDKGLDQVVTIPGHLLAKRGEILNPELPFGIRVKTYYGNSEVSEKAGPGMEQVSPGAALGMNVWWKSSPHETVMDRRDMPSGLVELFTPQGSLGTYLVSSFFARPQTVAHNGRTYELTLRLARFYKPFSLHLLEFKHDVYLGTDTPKNFSSRVQLQRPDTGENREVLIYMNSPLRYWGETYYQASYDPDDKGTILQVVHNPSWLTPYFSCVLVAAGLIVQFLTHLVGFTKKRKTA
jgi:ResB-like family